MAEQLPKDYQEELETQLDSALEPIKDELKKMSTDKLAKYRQFVDSLYKEVFGKSVTEELKKQASIPDQTLVSTTPGLPFFPFVIPFVVRPHPQITPLLHALPRRKAPQDRVVRWKAIVNVALNTDVVWGEVPDPVPAPVDDYRDYQAEIKTLVAGRKVSFLAVAASRTFYDVLKLSTLNAIIQLHRREEQMVVQGDPASNPNAYAGLIKWITDPTLGGGIVLNLNTTDSSSWQDLSLDHFYTVFQRMYEVANAHPKLIVAHPRLATVFAKLWRQEVRAVVATDVGVSHTRLMDGARVFPSVFADGNEIPVIYPPHNTMPVYNLTIGGQTRAVTDILILDHTEPLPGSFQLYDQRGNAVEIWDLVSTRIIYLAPITLAYRVAAFKFSVLVPRAPIIQAVIRGVPLPAVA